MKWLFALFSVLCLPLAASAAYPDHPITILVGFPAGSAPDVAARVAATKLSEQLGQTIIVDNRIGASGTIATATAARAAPDGYTLLLGSASSLTVAPALYKNVAFDPVKSFTPIIQMLRGAFILSVRSNLPVTDLKGLISYAKANPGKLNFGSSGNGSLHHLCIEMLESATGIKMTHVPYKGSPQNWMALNNGEVDLICDSMPNPIASLQSGRARAIAVTGDDRVSSLPQVPTFKEQGVPEVNIIFWYGFLAPAGTPAPIVAKLNTAFANVFRDPEVVQRYREQGIEMTTGKPEEFGALVAREAKDWARIIKETGVQVD